MTKGTSSHWGNALWAIPFMLHSQACSSNTAAPEIGPPLESTTDLAPVVWTSIGLDLVLIPPGKFSMGSTDGPPNEQPVHTVWITKPYYMARTEVTQEQFAQFVAETRYQTTAEKDGGAKVFRNGRWELEQGATFRTIFPGKDKPAVAVSWDDAIAFCKWLTVRDRGTRSISATQVIRLPTEAEWEWAARGGGQDRFAGTDEPTEVCRYGNVPDKSALRAGLGRDIMSCDDGIGLETAPVGKYLPNPFGLYDMTGNVWEWVMDRSGPYPATSQVDPQGPKSGNDRIMRGGSWSGKLHGLQVSHRDGYPPSLVGGAIGFRIAMSARE